MGDVVLRARVWLGKSMSKSMVELKVVPGSHWSPGSPVWKDIMCKSRRGMVQYSEVELLDSFWRLVGTGFVGRA